MKQFLIPLMLLVGTAGCVETAIEGPATHADKTVLDEKAALAVESGYQLAAVLATNAVRTGIVKGDALDTLENARRRAYSAVQATRAAYAAGNAASFDVAVNNAIAAFAEIRTIVTKG